MSSPRARSQWRHQLAAEARFEPTGNQVRAARHFVAQHAPLRRSHDAELVTSELVTNAIEHAATPVTVRVSHAVDRFRVEVMDSSAIPPAVRDLLSDEDSGRGLHLVERLTDAWGVDSSDVGKTIWFELLLDRDEET